MPKSTFRDDEGSGTVIHLTLLCAAMLGATGDTVKSIGIDANERGYGIRLGDKEWGAFSLPLLDERKPDITIEDAGGGWRRVRMRWELDRTVAQDELAIPFSIATHPDFWWAPHLAPSDGDCIAQHVFRSPAMIVAEGAEILVIVPDLDICGAREQNPWFMDLNAPERSLWLGMAKTEIPEHVRFHKVPGMAFEPGTVELGFFVTLYRDEAVPHNPWGRVTDFLWRRYGKPLFDQGEPLRVPMDRYVEHTYRWAFDTWKDSMWHEFKIDGTPVAGPAFIVNVTQSPNYKGPATWREGLSIWNQAWFSTLRAMAGCWRYGQRIGDETLKARANAGKAFALAAPQNDGIFPGVYLTGMETVEIDGKTIHQSKGWNTGSWSNSNRIPGERGITPEWFHVLDESWTCLLMLRWHTELENDSRLVDYATTYADKLVSMQDAQGFFPAWLHPETLEPSDVLAQSPETSMSVTFLLALAECTGNAKYRESALRAMGAVLVEIVPGGRWEDFETYWSCCGWGKEEFLGKKIPRNAMYKQCSFSMYWTAEALLATYRATKNPKYLAWGERTLDELSMLQQVWQPPFIFIPALGGFGVMNFDGEWNDSRQCLFAELYMDYYKETGDDESFERGVAALKSAFVMMYCPENPKAKALWEKVWPFFGPKDYGFTMENYGHGGAVSPEGEGVGEFTIFTWGNGAAAEARNRTHDHYGDVYLDRKRQEGFGIDSIRATWRDGAFELTDLAATPRNIKVVFEDGTSQTITLNGTTEIK